MSNIIAFHSLARIPATMVGLLLALAGGSFAALQCQEMTCSMEARLAVPPQEIAVRGVAGASADLVEPVVADMRAKGVAIEVEEASGNGAGTSYILKMTSSGTLDDFRRQFDIVIMPQLRSQGGNTETNITGRWTHNTASDVVLAADPSTGYRWTVAGDSDFQSNVTSPESFALPVK